MGQNIKEKAHLNTDPVNFGIGYDGIDWTKTWDKANKKETEDDKNEPTEKESNESAEV